MIHQPPPRIEKHDVVMILRTRKPARVELVDQDIVVVSMARPDSVDKSRRRRPPDLAAYRAWELSVFITAAELRDEEKSHGKPPKQRNRTEADYARAREYKRIQREKTKRNKQVAV